jgi:putative Holliday junction resolvase
VSDPLGVTVRALGEVTAATREEMVTRVAELAREHEVERVVVGLPRNMDGSEGPRAASVRAFAKALGSELAPRPVELIDERLTTFEARRLASEQKPRRADPSDAKTRTNLLAAQIILRNYLDAE